MGKDAVKGNGQPAEKVQKWKRDYDRRYYLKLNAHTDPDIVEKFKHVESIQGYIKALVRADIEKNGL